MRVDGEIPVRKIVREILNSSPRTGLATAEVIDNLTGEHTWLVLFGDGETLAEIGEIIGRGDENAEMAGLLSDTTKRIIAVLYHDLPIRDITDHVAGYLNEEDATTAAERMHALVEDEIARMRAEKAVDTFISMMTAGLDLDDLDDLDDMDDLNKEEDGEEPFWRRKTHD